LLNRVNPAVSLPEVMAVVVRFDWFLELIDKGVSGQALWDYFFEDALPHSEREARARVRAALLLSEESADFEGEEVRDEDATDDAPIEYKSMDPARSWVSHRCIRDCPKRSAADCPSCTTVEARGREKDGGYAKERTSLPSFTTQFTGNDHHSLC
jgi:hypothetical protein